MDTLQCIELAAASPPGRGQLRVLNQFTERFSVNQLAERVKLVGDRMGLSVQIQSVENPRKEAEEHYYNPVHSGLLDLGLKPHFLTDDVMAAMLERIHQHRDAIDIHKNHQGKKLCFRSNGKISQYLSPVYAERWVANYCVRLAI